MVLLQGTAAALPVNAAALLAVFHCLEVRRQRHSRATPELLTFVISYVTPSIIGVGVTVGIAIVVVVVAVVDGGGSVVLLLIPALALDVGCSRLA